MTGPIRELRRGLKHVIDHRTSDICLDLAERKPVVDIDEPFDTLVGPQMHPPFHPACRSYEVPVIESELEPHGASYAQVTAEERARGNDASVRPRPPAAPVGSPGNRRERRARRRAVARGLREERRRQRDLRHDARDNRGLSTYDPSRRADEGRSTTPPPGPSVVDVRVPGDGPLPSPAAPRRRTLRDWVGHAAELRRVHDPLDTRDDAAMRVLLREQRWAGRPVVVDRERHLLAAAVAGHVLYRGLAAATLPARSYAAALAYGALFLGLGAAGVGIYMHTNMSTAEDYAGPDGVVLRATPLPGARVVGVEDLLRIREREVATLSDREQRSLAVLLDDPGRLAAALGIDAVRFPDGTVLVVNRTALAVEEP